MATLVVRNAICLARNKVGIYKILSCGLADKKAPTKKTTTAQPEPPKPASTAKTQSASSPKAKPTTAADDNTKYQAVEYFGFNQYSFYDLDMTIKPSRLKPPSKYAPLKPKA